MGSDAPLEEEQPHNHFQGRIVKLLGEPVAVPPAKPCRKDSPYFLCNLDQNLAVIMQTVYFFKASQHCHLDPAQVVRNALKEVLVLYYPLAGRLSLSPDMKLEILCNDAGALFVEAEADISIEHFVEESNLGKGLDANLMQFVYNLPNAKSILDIPPLVVQVTKFRCGGFVLGLGMSHAISDGVSAMEFINCWGELARGLPISVTPFLDRSTLKARTPLQIEFSHPEYLDMNSLEDLDGADKGEVAAVTAADLVFKSIVFDEERLTALKNSILKAGVLDRCSSFEAFAALVWKSRTAATMSCGRTQKQAKLLFAVDIRNRLEPALPKGYVGNGIILTCALTSAQDLVEGSLSHAIELIREAINKVDNAYLRSLIDFNEKTRLRPSLESTLVITTWSRLSFHTIDFGWGTPLFTAPASLPEPEVALFLPHGESRRGFELVLGLPPPAMQNFVHLLENSWK